MAILSGLEILWGLHFAPFGSEAGFSMALNFQDVMTSKLQKLDVSVQKLEVMQ